MWILKAFKKLKAKPGAAWNNAELLLTIEHWALALMACALVLAIIFLILGK